MNPFVSVVVVMRNEERYIGCCLDSLLGNVYEPGFEVLVVDGLSTDRSVEIVDTYTERFPAVRRLENPKRIQAAGMNLGLREARGTIILRADAHCVYPADYIRTCVALLDKTGAANVGGIQAAIGEGYIGEVISIAVTTPFGVGDARYRYSRRAAWVDTVFLGAWRRGTLDALGGFNEEWVVNEDYELNHRLRKAGGKIYLSPEIRAYYYVRDSYQALARQYWRYGFWRAKTLTVHPDAFRWGHLAPVVLVLGLTVSPVLGVFHWPLGLIAPSVYLVANMVASFSLAVQRGMKYFPGLLVAFPTIHLCWGCGLIAGLFRWTGVHRS